MAKCDIKLPDVYMEKLARLGSRTDEICEKALEAGGAVVLAKVKSNLYAAVGRGTKYGSRSTGELKGALGLSPAKVGHDGNHNIKIGFAEPRRGGGSNAKIANILEYGKHGQAPKPFLKPAKSASKAECIETMKRVFEEEAGKL